MKRPWRRASMGTYEAVIDGARVVFQRDVGRGFILRMGKGSLSVRYKRLRDAYAVAVGAVDPKVLDTMETDAPIEVRPPAVRSQPRAARSIETDISQMKLPFVTGGGDRMILSAGA